MITVGYTYTWFGFRFFLSPFNSTTPRACITACHHLFGDIIRDFTMCFLTYSCTFLSYNISNYLLIITSQDLRFTHVIWDFLGRISVSNNLHTLVSRIFLLLYLIVTLLYKYGCYYPSHLGRIRTRTSTNLL